MTLANALDTIRSFWDPEEPFPFGKEPNEQQVEQLQAEYNIPFPTTLQEYLLNAVPESDVYLDTVGNPMGVYGADRLGAKQDGYSYNPITQEAITDWPDSFFLFADEGADPVVLDLALPEEGIQKLMHGADNWQAGETIADSFGQFLLCSAALHHALNAFEEEPIVDDETGFNLAPNAARWFFPNMKVWAGPYYDSWCSVFDNH